MQGFLKLLTVCLVGAGCVLLSPGSYASVAAEAPCSACHNETAKSFANQPHGRAFASDTEADADCTSCHGDGSAHMAAPARVGSIIKFRDEPAHEIAATCGSCHKDVHPAGVDPHVQAGLTCTSCHTVHHEKEKQPLPARLRDLDAASTTCFECHQDTFTQFNFNEGHRLTEGSISCNSCHDPHAPGVGLRLGGFKNEQCSTCHADKDGPFVFEHSASRVEGCGACHTPHGSPNRHMLTHQDTGALCYTCHAGVPQFHLGFAPAGSPRFGQQSVCTNCHVTIHGSNLDRNFLR